MSSDTSKITTPDIVLYGPDTRNEAIKKKGYKNYVYYLVWYEDGAKCEKSTKARFPDRVQAEGALEEWLRKRREARTAAPSGGYRPHEVKVGWVLQEYLEGHGDKVESTDSLDHAITALNEFWQDRLLSEVGEPTCEDYKTWRMEQPTRQSLEARAAWERRCAAAAPVQAPPVWSKKGGNDKAALLKRRAQKQAWRRREIAIGMLPEDQQAEALAAMGDPPWDPRPPRKKPAIIGAEPPLAMASESTARNDLAILAAAIHYCRRRLKITDAPMVTLPARGKSREEWCTRRDFAKMLLAARAPIEGLPELRRHLIVFLKVAAYHGARTSAILELPFVQPFNGGGWIDVKNGIIDFGPGHGKKERSRHARIHSRVLVYVRGAAKRKQKYLIERLKPKIVETPDGPKMEYDSVPIKSVRTSFEKCVKRAGIKKRITPHTLRHTSVSWLKQEGLNSWKVGDYVGMSEATVNRVYGHHDPEHQKDVIAATTSGRRPRR